VRASPRAPYQGGHRSELANRQPDLDDLMRKLLVVHRLLEAEECLAKHKPRRNG